MSIFNVPADHPEQLIASRAAYRAVVTRNQMVFSVQIADMLHKTVELLAWAEAENHCWQVSAKHRCWQATCNCK